MVTVPSISNSFRSVLAKSAAFTAGSIPTLYTISASSDYTITLPPAAGLAGLRLGFKVDSITNQAIITLDGNGSETIEKDDNLKLYVSKDYVELECDGTEWWIVSDGIQAHTAQVFTADTPNIPQWSIDQISFDNVHFDNAGLWDSDADKYIIRRAGRYKVIGHARLPVGSLYYQSAWLYLNGSHNNRANAQQHSYSDGGIQITQVYDLLDVGDAIDFRLRHSSPSTIDADNCYFFITEMRP